MNSKSIVPHLNVKSTKTVKTVVGLLQQMDSNESPKNAKKVRIPLVAKKATKGHCRKIQLSLIILKEQLLFQLI